MALSASTYQLLLAQVGDTPDHQLAGLADPLRAAEAAWDNAPAVQEQAVKLRMLDILITYWRDQMSRLLNKDERETMKLRLTDLQALRTATVTAQTIAAQAVAATGEVVVGRLTTQAPIESPWGAPDANAIRYSGDPNRRGGWR